MEWQDEGVVLTVRRHGESSAVASLLTRAHGRHAGLVRGGAGQRARPVWQPGNRLQVTWRARLAEQLGSFSGELLAPNAALVLDDPGRLAGIGSACALLDATLPERDPHPDLYEALLEWLDELVRGGGAWLENYVRFEVALLAELGFGLDFSVCAVTGGSDDLVFVSPKSGRAVSRAGAGQYAPRLLPLPPFVLGKAPADLDQVRDGLRLTGAFLRRYIFDASERPVPAARERFASWLATQG